VERRKVSGRRLFLTRMADRRKEKERERERRLRVRGWRRYEEAEGETADEALNVEDGGKMSKKESRQKQIKDNFGFERGFELLAEEEKKWRSCLFDRVRTKASDSQLALHS
jgi:hypothetical protein